MTDEGLGFFQVFFGECTKIDTNIKNAGEAQSTSLST